MFSRKTIWILAVPAGLLVVIALAVATHYASRALWEARVWSCFSKLGSGSNAVPEPFVIPSDCRTESIFVANLGRPNAEVVLLFPPPATMWISRLSRTVDYETYSIVLRRKEGVVLAEMHHGSD